MERRKVTLDDVARLARVSSATASRVVNGQPAVSAPTRERVQRAIHDLGYRPDAAARALATGRGAAVDLVIVDDDHQALSVNPFYGRVIGGVLDALADTDVRLRIHRLGAADTARGIAEISRRVEVGALLVNVPPVLAELFREAGDRVVSLGGTAPGMAWIDSDNIQGAHTGIHHLFATGRRRIAGLGGMATGSCGVNRGVGYHTAMSDLGRISTWLPAGSRTAPGVAATRELLLRHPDVDAIFAGCDFTGVGALQVLAEAGRRVPDDVAVVGFDDSVLASCATPAMSSVLSSVEEIAETATRAALARDLTGDWQITLPVALTVRHSSVA